MQRILSVSALEQFKEVEGSGHREHFETKA